MKLTAKTVNGLTLPAGKGEALYFDDSLPGFGVRLRAGAQPVWVFQYKIGDQQRRKSLGPVTAMRLEVARRHAEELHAQTVLGRDPIAAIKEERARGAQTFGAAVEAFLHWQRTRQRRDGTTGVSVVWLYEIERYLLTYASALHDLPLRKVGRGDVARLITTIHRERGPVAGNTFGKVIGALFSWAIKNAWTDVNPAVGVPREEEASRARVLLPAEIRAIWRELGDDQYAAIVKLLLLTGCRREEIGGLRRSEIHDNAIALPSARTKNRRGHVIPLAPMAREIIAAQPLRVDANGTIRDLLFGLGSGGFNGWGKAKAKLDAQITSALGESLPPWTIHDLRRSVATYCTGGLPAHLLATLPVRDREFGRGLAVPPHVVEALLNHASGHKAGVAGTYNRSTYETEKAHALALWANHVSAIVEGTSSKVTMLRA
jgi:integrase